MAQTIQILRTTTNTPPPTLLPGALSAELGPQTKLWIGAAAGNRLLLSTDPTDITLSGGAIIASAAPNAMPGSLWWDSNIGQLYIRYFDGNSTAWVTASNGSNIAIPLGVASGGTGATSLPLNDGGSTWGLTRTLLRTNGTVVSPASGTGGTVGTYADCVLVSLGLNQNSSLILGHANGTFASPTAVLNGENLGAISFDGTFAGSWCAFSRALIVAAASENWTSTANGTSFQFLTTANGTTTTTTRMTLDAAGLNLIGAYDGAHYGLTRLRLNGHDFAADFYDGTSRYQVIFDVSGNGSLYLGDLFDANNYYQQTGHVFTDRPGTTIFARITAGGLTIAGGANPTLGTAAGFTALWSPDGSSTNSGLFYGPGGAAGVAYYRIGGHQFQGPTASPTYAIFDIASTRNISGAWAVISDRGAKVEESIKPYKRGLEAIVALNPVEFRYAAGTPFALEDEPSRLLFGLIADEVKPHIPEIVGSTTATVRGVEDVSIDTLEPGNLIYACINAIKELNAKVEALTPALPAARR